MYEISQYLPYFQKTRTVVRTTASSTVQLCPASPDRVILMVSIPLSQNYWLFTQNIQDTTQADIAGSGPDTVWIDWRRNGPLVTEAFWGQIFGASGPVQFVVTEYTFRPPADDVL